MSKRRFILFLVGFAIGIVLALVMISVAKANQVIYAKGLSQHGCDDTEWHFIITQVDPPENAPAEIYVTWSDGSQETLPLDGVTGQAAHYYWYDHLNVPVREAWTEIYDGWNGQFNLSHGPCFDDPTPTPPTPPTPTDTEVPSATPTVPVDTPTNTPTITQEQPTYTPTATGTQTPTSTIPPTETPTQTPSKTATPITYTPTITPTTDPRTPSPTPTNTFVPTSTSTNVPTPTETDMPTQTPTTVPTSTPTGQPTSTPTILPTDAPEPTETPRPPMPAEALSIRNYQGAALGTIFMDGTSYKLFQGINAPDGTLALPSSERGAALYENTIWVHRAWNTGWLHLKVGDFVMVTIDETSTMYKVTERTTLPYGVYPKGGFYVATCMSVNGKNWTNVELFKLESQNKIGEQK